LKYQVLLSSLIFIFILSISGTVAAANANNTTDIVSIATNGSMSDGYSSVPSISADGRYVAFTSYADNLVANNTNYNLNVYVRDTILNTTTLVSVSSTGEQGDSDSYTPSISSNGRYIAFSSDADNLVSNDINGYEDVFLRDTILNTTTLVSVSSTGEQGDSDSSQPSISANGNYIAYTSDADNLVPNDSNGYSDVFVYDQASNTTKIVSVSSTGEHGDSSSYQPSISGTGRYIAFCSFADNLVSNDTNGLYDVFVYDQNSGDTERVSLQNSGAEIDKNSRSPSISVDGNYVAFVVGNSIAPCIVMGGLKSPNTNINSEDNLNSDEYYNYQFIYVYDMITGTTNKVSVSSTGEDADTSSVSPSINADGSIIAFSSDADNLVPNDTNYCSDIFIHTDNNINSFSGSIIPSNVKSGDSVTLKAYSENATNITALLFNKTLNLSKQSDGRWSLNYIIPNVPDGNYSTILTATDIEGNLENLSLNLTVDNTPPTITGTLSPTLLKSGTLLTIEATSDSDTKSIVASIAGSENINMYQDTDGTWWLYYTLPTLPSNNYTTILTTTDNVGNQGTDSLNFAVDNTPPTVIATITPGTLQLIDGYLPIDNNTLTIKATSDPDTASIVVDNTYNMIQQ